MDEELESKIRRLDPEVAHMLGCVQKAGSLFSSYGNLLISVPQSNVSVRDRRYDGMARAELIQVDERAYVLV